jgi:hypothetical protein
MNQMIEPTRLVPRKTRARPLSPQDPHAQWPAGTETSAPLRVVARAAAPHAGQPIGAWSPLQPQARQK